MKHDHSKFILCPRDKGMSKRHVDICAKCRWKKRCRAYKTYVQPYLPMAFFTKKA